MRKGQKGFSLIELMIVVVIIGLLATVGVPQYQKFIAKTRQAEAKSMMSGLYTAEKAFFAEWNQYYGDFRAIGYQPDGQLTYNVGFANGGAPGPATHPNATYAGVNAALFSAQNTCGTAPAVAASINCQIIGVPVALSGVAVINNAAAIRTFTVEAAANIDGDATPDRWTINQNKLIQVTSDDVDL